MLNLNNVKNITIEGNTIESITGKKQGLLWEREAEFTRAVIHSEDDQYVYTGVMNTGDYILEGRFRVNYIDPPTANGDGNWLFGARQTGSQTLGVFVGTSGLFAGYGGSTSAQRPNIIPNVWYTYRLSLEGCTMTTDDGIVTNYNLTSPKLIPEANGVEISICNVTYGYTGGVEKRRMWGDHDYHKLTDRITGEVLYLLEAGTDKDGVACFYDIISKQFKYSESGKNFTTVDALLSGAITDLNHP